MRRIVTVLTSGLLASGLLIGLTAGAEQPGLGNAANYAVMAATTITNTGFTVIDGSLAISPNGSTSVTGFPPGVVTGTPDFNNTAAIDAATDLVTAYTAAAGEPFTVNLTGQDLGGLTLGPGVYHFDSSAQLTGTLTLDGEGSTNPAFIFQIGSTLTTASASSVQLINGAGGCAVFWQVGSSATLGTTTAFQGTIMALASITATTGVTVGAGGGSNGGRLLALNAAVTMDTNLVVQPSTACVFAPAATATPVPTETPAPTAVPTDTPSPAPTATPVPTAVATAVPTAIPTAMPTAVPTAVPTAIPTAVPALLLAPIPTPTPSLIALIGPVPTAVPSQIAAVPVSPAPSTSGPEVELVTISPAPRVPNTSLGDQPSSPVGIVASMLVLGLFVLALSPMLALRRRETINEVGHWRPRRESNPRRRP